MLPLGHIPGPSFVITMVCEYVSQEMHNKRNIKNMFLRSINLGTIGDIFLLKTEYFKNQRLERYM
jgi:hypothetical protein